MAVLFFTSFCYNVKINDYVKQNDIAIEVYSKEQLTDAFIKELKETITITANKNKKTKNIYKII